MSMTPETDAAVIAAMEAVPINSLLETYREEIDDALHSFEDPNEALSSDKVVEMAMEAIRARLIQAAREAAPSEDWQAKYKEASKELNDLRLSQYLYGRVTEALGIENDVIGHVKNLKAKAEKAELERGICEDNAMKLQTELAEAKATIEALKQAEADSVSRPSLSRLRPLTEADPYAELKAAKAAGKTIECKLKRSNAWTDYDGDFTNLDSRYELRVKPEPETFEAHGKTWTRHTPGDPMPTKGGSAFVQLLLSDGSIGKTDRADLCIWNTKPGPSDQIIGWRYADQPEHETFQADDKVKTPRTDAIIASDTGDSGFIAELAKLSRSLEEENADLKEALEKAKEFVQSWGEIVDTQYSLWNECIAAINKALK